MEDQIVLILNIFKFDPINRSIFKQFDLIFQIFSNRQKVFIIEVKSLKIKLKIQSNSKKQTSLQ